MERDICSLMHVQDRLGLVIGRSGTQATIRTWQDFAVGQEAAWCLVAMSASHSAGTRGAPAEPSSDSEEDIVCTFVSL